MLFEGNSITYIENTENIYVIRFYFWQDSFFRLSFLFKSRPQPWIGHSRSASLKNVTNVINVYHSAISPIGRRWGREASDFAAQLQSVWPERPLGPHQRRPNLPSSWLQASVQRRHEGNLLGRSGITDPLLFHLFRWANCPGNKLSNVRIILLVPSKKILFICLWGSVW